MFINQLYQNIFHFFTRYKLHLSFGEAFLIFLYTMKVPGVKLRIKELIYKNGYSIKEFCKLMGITPSTYYGYLKGNPTIEVLQKIANTLQVNISELFVDQDKDFYGLILYKGQMYKIDNFNDFMELAKKVFDNYGFYIGKL